MFPEWPRGDTVSLLPPTASLFSVEFLQDELPPVDDLITEGLHVCLELAGVEARFSPETGFHGVDDRLEVLLRDPRLTELLETLQKLLAKCATQNWR